MLIDFELCARIGSASTQGTKDFFSIATKKSFETKSSHTNKKRDDFESLFLVTILLMNRKLFPWGPDERDETLLSKMKFEDECLTSIREMWVRNTDKELKNSLERLKLWRDQLYHDYPVENPELATDIDSIQVLDNLTK